MNYRMEPAYAYDLFDAKQEAAYAALVRGKHCGECMNCNTPNPKMFENPTRIGWCEEICDFVSLDELVEDVECETYYE